MKRVFAAFATSAAGVCFFFAGSAQAKITLDIDYSLDTGGFFNAQASNPFGLDGTAARTALNSAARVFSDRILDNLSAITPGGGNNWQPTLTHPSTGAQYTITTNPAIAANVIKVYAGGRSMSGSTLGIGGYGGYGGGGNMAWFDTIEGRGQAGALAATPTDFGPWGGSIAFNGSKAWRFDLAKPGAGEARNDFISVATHELAHLLGFGTSDSFIALESGLNFLGAKAKALNGGANVPLANTGHYAQSLTSIVAGVPQEVAMAPSITTGTRKLFTLLDFAGMDDLGWDLARPGDANASGNVDLNDLIILANNYGNSGGTMSWSTGDFNYDGNVDLNDLIALANNYGSTGALGADVAMAGGASGDAFAADVALLMAGNGFGVEVPEPGVLGWVGVIAGAVGFGRRRGR